MDTGYLSDEGGGVSKEEIIAKAAQDLFDNRLGWSEGRNPYAPRVLWAELGAALYGEEDPRVQELREGEGHGVG